MSHVASAPSQTLRAVRGAVRQLRSPDPARWYGASDPRSWAGLARAQRLQRAGFDDLRTARQIVLRGREGGRFLATLPRSGTNLLIAMIESAINLAKGADGEYDLVDGYWVSGDEGWKPRGDRHYWPNSMVSVLHAAKTARRPVKDPVVIGAHFPITRGVTDLGATGRPVVLVREPVAAIGSLLQKSQRKAPITTQHALSLAGGFASYFEYWSQMARRRGADVRVLRFEDLCVDPEQQLRIVSEHWDLGLTPAAISGAVELCSRERMTAKAAGDTENVRITLDRSTVDRELHDAVVERMRLLLDEPFGYSLSRPT